MNQRPIWLTLVFVIGVAVGASGYRLIQVRGHQDSAEWESFVNEDNTHARILDSHAALNALGTPKDFTSVNQKLDAQLKLQDLIIRYREAQYAKLTPLGAIVVPLLSAIVGGLITTVLGKKMRDRSNEANQGWRVSSRRLE